MIRISARCTNNMRRQVDNVNRRSRHLALAGRSLLSCFLTRKLCRHWLRAPLVSLRIGRNTMSVRIFMNSKSLQSLLPVIKTFSCKYWFRTFREVELVVSVCLTANVAQYTLQRRYVMQPRELGEL